MSVHQLCCFSRRFLLLSFLYLLAVPSPGWAQGGLVAGNPIILRPPGALSLLDISIDQVTWSPDGTKIAFTVGWPYEWRGIFLMNVDGTNLVRLADGNIIHKVHDPLGPSDYRNGNYYRNLINYSHLFNLAWSPDGTKIAFSRIDYTPHGFFGPGLYVMNVDKTDPVKIFGYGWLREGGLVIGCKSNPMWLPDKRLGFLGCRESSSGRHYGVYAVNADGSNLVQPVDLGRLTTDVRSPDSPSSVGFAKLSPDGSRIALRLIEYDSEDNITDDSAIIVINVDGTGRGRRVGDGRSRRIHSWEFSWSPDGTKIAYRDVRFLSRENFIEGYSPIDIFVVNADGATPPVNLTASIHPSPPGLYRYGNPTWLPDSTGIAAPYNSYYEGDDAAGYNAAGYNMNRIRIIPLTTEAARGDRRATLLNLSPWQAWVHLYCLKDRGTDAAPCAVTFECNGQSGEPASWPVTVAPKTIFSYWPNKTVGGLSANLQAALVAAGKPEDEARRRTTCEVFSPDPLTVRGYTLFGQPTLVPVAEPARPDVAGEPGERRRRATLPNLSPGQAWVHLYCLKDRGTDAAPCAVTFECNGLSGEPVTWPVEVGPKTIFSYWPNKTVGGMSANLQAALIAEGKPEDEARRRTTCEVSSADPIAVRGYTRFNGQPTLVPVTAY